MPIELNVLEKNEVHFNIGFNDELYVWSKSLS